MSAPRGSTQRGDWARGGAGVMSRSGAGATLIVSLVNIGGEESRREGGKVERENGRARMEAPELFSNQKYFLFFQF